MEVKFTVTKEERRALVSAIGELTGCASAYQGAPSFAFAVGNYIIDRDGMLVYDERTEAAELRVLLTELAARGFVFECDIDEISPDAAVPEIPMSGDQPPADSERGGNTSADAEPDETPSGRTYNDEDAGMLVVEVPLTGFTRTARDNLEKLVTGKADLIIKAIGVPESPADDLPIKQTESTLQFPWFPLPLANDAIDAYVKFVCALCEMAKKQKRVTLKDRDADPDSSDKFAFRCFLLRLGFKGDAYKSARRVLLSKLTGSGSFKSGDHKRRVLPSEVNPADSGTGNAEAITVRGSGNDADNAPTDGAKAIAPARCGDCLHHYYYTDGLLRTHAGDIVDTSNRTPDKYNHYCLSAPSGFRKIKYASDWSGFEAPPSWCPLSAMYAGAAAGGEDAAHE